MTMKTTISHGPKNKRTACFASDSNDEQPPFKDGTKVLKDTGKNRWVNK